MQTVTPVRTDLVLLGAGHAHAEVLRQMAMRPVAGVRVTLIAREAETPYSGMLPGLIRGEYAPAEAHLDCAQLAAAAGARLILAEATGIDPVGRAVRFALRPEVAFDLLSIDVGGQPEAGAGGLPVKPIGRFLARLADMEARLGAGARIAVVGGGASGVELAIAMAIRLRGRAKVVLVSAAREVLAGAPRRARRAAAGGLAAAGVEVMGGVRALRHEGGLLHLDDGRAIGVMEALWATGVRGPAFLAGSGVACDALGCVVVDATLRSVSHEAVFAAGDCAAVLGRARPKAGVWAVRAGAPLAENLRRAAQGRMLKAWRPQRGALAILGLGGGRAVAWRGGVAVEGAWVARWKARIDRRWMARYQALRPMGMEAARCGGCGAKIGAEEVRRALAGLVPGARADIPLGLAAGDDAAVTLPPAGMAVVQSVDHFRAFIDEPYVFGRIAAAHALSDIHAMGARPWTALAVAAVPLMGGRKMQDELAAMMRGAAEGLAEDGCALIGGHSAEGAEAALGFAVTGLVAPGRVWRKAGLRVGDALVLTKRLGGGIILAGHMRGLARAAWLQGALAQMAQSNGAAAAVLRRFEVVACTDVTGFGLGGHLGEMLRASGVAARIDPAGLPELAGAMELAAQGVESSLAAANAAALDIDGAGGVALLVDPQTSGGLLAGVADGAGCVAALRAAGVEAWVVGRVVEGRPGRIGLCLT